MIMTTMETPANAHISRSRGGPALWPAPSVEAAGMILNQRVRAIRSFMLWLGSVENEAKNHEIRVQYST